jgi:hypothetical protein
MEEANISKKNYRFCTVASKTKLQCTYVHTIVLPPPLVAVSALSHAGAITGVVICDDSRGQLNL